MFAEKDPICDVQCHIINVLSASLNKTFPSFRPLYPPTRFPQYILLSLVSLFAEKDQNPLEIIKEASLLIKTNHGIDDTTIQIEEYVNEMLDCSKCQDLKD